LGQYVVTPAIDLSSTRAVTVAFWSKRTYSTAGGHTLLESTADFTHSTTGFAVFPDDPACSGIQAAINGEVGETANCYRQPTSGIWHHFALVFDKTQSAGNQVALYLDGVLQNPTRNLAAATNTNDFGDNSIWLFSQGGTGSFDSGQLDELRIYKGALTAAEIQRIYRGSTTIKTTPTLNPPSQATAAAARTSKSVQQQSNPALDPVNGVTLDLHGVHDNGSQASNQAAVSIGTPAAGDLITCEVTFDGHNGNALVSLTDNNNGSYTAAVPAHLNTTLIQSFGIYYKQAVIAAPTTVTLKTTNAAPWSAVSCQAWKGIAASNPLDSAFIQSRDMLSTANPTTGANKTPAGNGELIITALGLYSAGAPTAGASYALIDTAPATQFWPEYSIQTNALPTAGNYVRSSDNFTDMMAAFKPASTSSFTIAASPASLSVVQGNSGTSTITSAVSGSFSNPITLSASGVPSGTTASFSVNPVPAPGGGSSVLTLNVGSSTAAGTYNIVVTGSGGGLQQSTTVTLKVTAVGTFTIGASPSSLTVVQGSSGTSTITSAVSGGFNNPVSLSASGVPAGTTASFSPNPIPAPGSGNSVLTIKVSSSTAAGTYNIVVTGSGGGLQQSTTITLKVSVAGTFTIGASPSALTAVQGSSATTTITTTVAGGFNNAVSLSASGVPAGTTASFSPNPIPAPGGGSSVLTLNVGSSTAVGTYNIVVTGSGGGLQQSTTVSLKVTLAGTFTISAAPSALTAVQGSSVTSTITSTVSGGFNNPVSLSASGVPSGTTASFSPNPIAAPGAGNSTLTLAVGSGTAAGTYNILVSGAGGGLKQSTTVTLTVTAVANFTIAVSPPSLGLVRGNQGTATITTSISGGFNSAITLSASGVPSGTTVSFSSNPIPAPGAGTSTMTVAVGSSTKTGTYSLTITGTGGGLQRSTAVSLTVVGQVTLAWTASVSPVVGYNAYRATQPTGPYTLLNTGLITGTTYLDQTVQSGVTYYYATTAVNAQGVESAYSNQATATVP
jgi:uncharacterized membrane protein